MKLMAKSYRLTIEGRDKYLNCRQGQTLLKSLTENGIFFEADCGGRGTCGKCKVKVLDGQIIDSTGTDAICEPDGSYLACRSYPKTDVVLSVKELKTGAKGSITETKDYEGLPIITKKAITLDYPTIENIYSLQEMIKKSLDIPESFISQVHVLRELAKILDGGIKLLTVTLFENEVIAVEAGNTEPFLFGAAFDIGTTTVAGMLIDLKTKKVIAAHSKTNPQTAFGADVISRIQAAANTENGLTAQSEAIRQCLNKIIKELCLTAGVNTNHIYAACIAGNSTMSHLLLNISPTALTRLPYAQVFETTTPFCPAEIGLNINQNGKVILLPNIASFIGSDTTAAIVAIDQDISTVPKLLVDLGTNGEMALSDGKNIYACSTAAGPAFEGAHIKNGMRAFEGAISEVKITNGEVFLKVIGDVKPVGICGSGVVMAVAELIKTGVISPSGRFNKPDDVQPSLKQRLKKNENNEWLFILCRAEETAAKIDISLTQGDIRQIQLVKSSILTGIEFLLEKLPEAKKENGIDVFLAGAFGNYIDIDSALTIGLFPKFEIGTVRSVGNAAGTGAVEAILSTAKFKRCVNISSSVKYLELASQPNFQNKFLRNLSLGHV